MSTQSLQGIYTAALFRVAEEKAPRDAKRYMPIFQRPVTSTKTQAIKDAANALRTLWKKKRPSDNRISIVVQRGRSTWKRVIE